MCQRPAAEKGTGPSRDRGTRKTNIARPHYGD